MPDRNRLYSSTQKVHLHIGHIQLFLSRNQLLIQDEWNLWPQYIALTFCPTAGIILSKQIQHVSSTSRGIAAHQNNVPHPHARDGPHTNSQPKSSNIRWMHMVGRKQLSERSAHGHLL